jgi:hypothetical protein
VHYPKVERRILGVVEVDSGTLVIGDPAYALPRTIALISTTRPCCTI